MDRPLNPRQRKFCRLYVEYGDAKKAAEDSGYAAANADKHGSRMLKNRRIALYISDIRAAHIKKTDITLERILGQLWFHGSSGSRDSETVSSLKALLKYAENIPLEGDEKNIIRLGYSLPPERTEPPKKTETIERMSDEEIKKEMGPDIDPELGF